MEHVGEVQRSFDLSGGALCLDFANTLDDRSDSHSNELLQSYADLLAFARQAGSLPEAHLDCLDAEAAHHAADAESALARPLAVREVVYRIFAALADHRPVDTLDLDTLNRSLSAALVHARVMNGEDATRGADPARFAWAWASDPVNLDAPLWPVVRSAVDLLTSAELPSLRLCAADTCAWLFLDTSRNGSRRWCSMRTCGNRAKARRHHARVRAANDTAPG